MIKKYYRVWKQMTLNAISTVMSNRIDASTYFIGKVVRFFLYYIFIVSLFSHTREIAEYTKDQVIFFYITFTLIDNISQAFFRGIYLFKREVQRGDFDFSLVRPIHPLFFSMTRLTDVLDAIFLIPLSGFLIFYIIKLNIILTISHVFAYLFFFLISIILILCVHILSACVTILTVESEDFIWLYRELITIGRFPPEIFSQTIQYIFTVGIPVLLITAFPPKALLGLLSFKWMLFGFLYVLIFVLFTAFLWKISIKKYSSASS